MKENENKNSSDKVIKLDESDLKTLKELENVVKKFENPFWKIIFVIIAINSILILLYEIGYIIGKLIA